MMKKSVAHQILVGTHKAGKDYSFDAAHDPRLPAQMWFQESNEGPILFVVFYSQACRWSRCVGCNLPSRMSESHVPFGDLMAQVDHVFRDPAVAARRLEIRKFIASNNGSILDEETFSSTALMYLLAQINLNMPNLAVLTLETRPEYVDLAELEFISRALNEGQTPTDLELAVGFEAFDDHVRNEVFDKGLPLGTFERLVGDMAPYGFRLKSYFMQKPVPGMSDEAAVNDVEAAIDYHARLSRDSGVLMNIHLNPTYVACGTPLAHAFEQGQYAPPLLADVARAALRAEGTPLSLFLGLSDEGMAVPGGSFVRSGDEPVVRELERFNRTQDYAILRALARKP